MDSQINPNDYRNQQGCDEAEKNLHSLNANFITNPFECEFDHILYCVSYIMKKSNTDHQNILS